MAKIFLKVRKYQLPPIGDYVCKPTWMVCHSVCRDFEPGGCSWPHLIRSEPMTLQNNIPWTEEDAERSMRSYAFHLARQRPNDYELVP